MKNSVIGVLILALLIGGGYLTFARAGAGALSPVAPTPTPGAIKAGTTIAVEAVVVPQASVELRFPATDIVGAVLVREGQRVERGVALARLERGALELRLAQARASLNKARADYDELKLGATPEELAAAQAQVAQAQGQLRQTRGSVTGSDIAGARAELDSARAELARLEAGPASAEVQAAKAALTQARTALAELEAGPPPAEVAAAQAALDQARTRLAELEAGPPPAEVAAAQAALDQATATYQRQAGALSSAKTRAHTQMEQAANALRLAQTAYSSAAWNDEQAQRGINPQTGKRFSAEGQDEEAQQRPYAEALRVAELEMQQAEQALVQAQVDYEQARQDEIVGVAAAQAALDQAQATYDQVRTAIDASALAAARAEVAQAEATYDQLVRIDPVQRTAAQAQVAQAQANLDKLLRTDPSVLSAARARVAQAQAQLSKLQGEEQAGRVAAAEAAVNSAEANLTQLSAETSAPALARALANIEIAQVAVQEAEFQLSQATLRAPMSGTVAQINLKVGEAPPREAPALVLADFSVWQVETTDLTELDIVRITEGAAVTVTVDALPNVELAGTVTHIKSIGVNKQGDITYTAVVTLARQDARLRWNMSAIVRIDTP